MAVLTSMWASARGGHLDNSVDGNTIVKLEVGGWNVVDIGRDYFLNVQLQVRAQNLVVQVKYYSTTR